MVRTLLIRGPAKITRGSANIHTQGDIQVKITHDLTEIKTSAHGKAGERYKNRMVEVTFTPSGQWNAAGIAALWPYASTAMGASVMTGSDVPLIIHSLAGQKLTFKASALSKVSSLTFSAAKTLIGSCTFVCCPADDTQWTASANMILVESTAYAAGSFDPEEILVQPYTVAWGSSPWDAIQTEDGVTIDFPTSLKPHEIDSLGIIDYTLEKHECVAKCKPRNVTEAQVIAALNIQESGSGRGKSLYAVANDFVVTGTGLTFTMVKSAMVAGGLEFGTSTPRIGELTWNAQRKFTSGAAQPLYTIA
jgi:hypothetical protein